MTLKIQTLYLLTLDFRVTDVVVSKEFRLAILLVRNFLEVLKVRGKLKLLLLKFMF